MLLRLVLALLVLTPNIAAAQDWIKYVNRDLQFTIHFPRAPQITQTHYVTASGASVPAHIILVDAGSARYKLTVADFSAQRGDQRGAAEYAAETLSRRGEAQHNPYAYIDGLTGHHLSVLEPDGRRLVAAVYLFDHRLYIAEGSDLISEPPPGTFTHSIIITHSDGTQLNLDGYNAESFNAFESEY